MYKLIAFDCDGTLLNDKKQIDSETISAIKELKKRGIKVVLATSRPFYKVKKYLEQLDLIDKDEYTVSFNGGLILNNNESKILHKEVLPIDVVRMIINYGKNYDLYTFIYEEDKIISNDYCDEYVNLSPETPFFVFDLDKLDLSSIVAHKVIIHGSSDEVAKARDNLGTSYNDICEVTSSNVNNIEFIPFGNSKPNGLKIIGKKLNIKPSEMIAFGDNENDLAMFDYVGYKVAMGNSIDELKEKANKITLSNNDNGIAVSLSEMIEEEII